MRARVNSHLIQLSRMHLLLKPDTCKLAFMTEQWSFGYWTNNALLVKCCCQPDKTCSIYIPKRPQWYSSGHFTFYEPTNTCSALCALIYSLRNRTLAFKHFLFTVACNLEIFILFKPHSFLITIFSHDGKKHTVIVKIFTYITFISKP